MTCPAVRRESAIPAIKVAIGLVQVSTQAAPLFRRHPLAPFLHLAASLVPEFVAAIRSGLVAPLPAFFKPFIAPLIAQFTHPLVRSAVPIDRLGRRGRRWQQREQPQHAEPLQRRSPAETPCCLLPLDHACPAGLRMTRS